MTGLLYSLYFKVCTGSVEAVSTCEAEVTLNPNASGLALLVDVYLRQR